jgi:hypothetical protein
MQTTTLSAQSIFFPTEPHLGGDCRFSFLSSRFVSSLERRLFLPGFHSLSFWWNERCQGRLTVAWFNSDQKFNQRPTKYILKRWSQQSILWYKSVTTMEKSKVKYICNQIMTITATKGENAIILPYHMAAPLDICHKML